MLLKTAFNLSEASFFLFQCDLMIEHARHLKQIIKSVEWKVRL